MIRTQIQLPREEHVKLRAVAARQGRSMADCIREGIRLFLNRSRTRDGDLEGVLGNFRPLAMKDLKPHDRWVAEAVMAAKPRKRKK